MRRSSLRTLYAGLMAASLLVTSLVTTPALAQGRPAPTLEVSAGLVAFPDDGIVRESAIGAAGRFALSPRVSIGPEAVLISGEGHGHVMLTGNLVFDLVPSPAGRPAVVTPFLVVGGGLFHTWESFGGGNATHTEGAFTAGGGVRARVGDRTTLGVDVRLGWETHVRVSGVVGIRLGR